MINTRFRYLLIFLCVSFLGITNPLFSIKKSVQNDEYLKKLKTANDYQNQYAYNKAIVLYDEIIKIIGSDKDMNQNLIYVLKNKSFCCEQLGLYNDAINTNLKLAELYKENNLLTENAILLEKISKLYLLDKNYKESISTELLLLNYYIKINSNLDLAKSYNNLGFLYKKINNSALSLSYFNKSLNIIRDKNNKISDDNIAIILLNIGIIRTDIGDYNDAEIHFKEALEIRKKQNKPVEEAKIKNYLAAHAIINSEYSLAQNLIQESISLCKKNHLENESSVILSNSYKLMCDLLLLMNDIKGFKYYINEYFKIKDNILIKKEKINQMLFENQLEIEKKENILRFEKERQSAILRESELRSEKKQKELEIKAKELEIKAQELYLLTQKKNLQEAILINQNLERDKISQELKITQQNIISQKQKQKITLLEKDKLFKNLAIEKQKQDYQILQIEKEKKQQQLLGEKKLREIEFTAGILIIILLILLLCVMYYYLNQRKIINKKIALQNKIIQEKNIEITSQNHEFIIINTQLAEQTNLLHTRNLEMKAAEEIITFQNIQLKQYNEDLELLVYERTRELSDSNSLLLKNNAQLEQFAYIISHNIRGPVARILGLSQILDIDSSIVIEPKLNDIIQKMFLCAKDIDTVIRDLNQILEIKNGIHEILIDLYLSTRIKVVLQRLDYYINETSTKIHLDIENDYIKSVSAYIESIFYNLISNAIKYKDPNRNPEIFIKSYNENNCIIIEIKDNGTGIDLDKFKDKIFGLYKRFHSGIKGKGMGLFLVKTQVEALGGTINIESELNIGTKFIISFPIANQ